MTNAASTRGLARQRERQRADLRDEALVVQNLMRTDIGRRWMWLRLSECGVFQATTNLDPQTMAYTAGTRNVGLALLSSVMRHVPDLYIRMTNENSSAQLQENPDGGTDASDESDTDDGFDA